MQDLKSIYKIKLLATVTLYILLSQHKPINIYLHGSYLQKPIATNETNDFAFPTYFSYIYSICELNT